MAAADGPPSGKLTVQAADGAQQPLQTLVTFHAKFDEVQFGESVCVVGSHPSIGAWNPEGGVVLKTTDEIFPSWITTKPVPVETFARVEYKYLIRTQDGQVRCWETYTGNREFVTTGAEMTVEDDEGHYRQFVLQAEAEDEEEEQDTISKALTARTPSIRKMVFDHKMNMVEELEGNVKINTHTTIFMVALQLPVKVVKRGGIYALEDEAPNDGRNFAWLPLVEEFRKKSKVRIVCVGWPGVHADTFNERAEIEKLLAKRNCIPVFPPRQDFEHYVSFCATFLWPVFHDVMTFFQTAKPLAFDMGGWAAYQHVNNLYANAVVPHTHESDIIWVHDYHMCMLPTFISKRMPKANIGFYLHTPFPSSDSFKSLPIREELLSGMLCADQLGFQFFAYARAFLVSVKRTLGLEPSFRSGGFIGLEYSGRHVMLKVAHFVYPFQDTQMIVRSDAVQVKAAEVRKLFEGKIVFASMDRCDNLSGLVPKFRAFKRFLRTHSEFRGRAVLVQYTFESTVGYDPTNALLNALRDRADAYLQLDDNGDLHINSKGDGECDIFLRLEMVDRIDRLALFRAADVLLDTSANAGLNLMPFEFITAHHDDEKDHGAVIVSEFSGCSRVLLGSIRINPWNTNEVVAACERAIKMSPLEKKELNLCNLTYVAECSPFEWFKDFLQDLSRARKKEGVRIQNIGFGAKIRPVVMTENFQKLPIEAVCGAYRRAKNRVFFLDNEGTLAADSRHLYREYGAPKGSVSDLKSRGSPPDEQVLDCLRTLCADQRNTVVILSGRDRRMLEDWFGSVKRLGLAAERGFYYKLPMMGGQWHCMVQDPDYTWQSYAFEIMRQFVKRTQGSFIESKGSALVWQYRDVDPYFGSMQAKELSSHLKDLLFGFDVDVLNGKGYVEVKLRGINKGVAVSRVLQKITQMYGDVDFILCIGDDRSDEDMFEAVAHFSSPEDAATDNTSSQLSTADGESDGHSGGEVQHAHTAQPEEDQLGPMVPESSFMKTRKLSSGLGSLPGARGDLMKLSSGQLGRDDSGNAAANQKFFTCTVGRKPSAAHYFLDDVEEVSEVLSNIKLQQERSGRRQSKDHMSSYTWSGGDLRGPGMRVASQPALSSLAFAPIARQRP